MLTSAINHGKRWAFSTDKLMEGVDKLLSANNMRAFTDACLGMFFWTVDVMAKWMIGLLLWSYVLGA